MRELVALALRTVFVTTSFPSDADDASGHFVRTEAMNRAARGDDVIVVAPGDREQVTRDGALTLVTFRGGGAFGWPGVSSRISRAPWLFASAARWVHDASNCVRALVPDEVVAHWVLPSAWPIASRAKAHAGHASTPRVVGVSHGADVRLLLRMPALMRNEIVTKLTRSLDSWRFVSRELAESLLAHVSKSHASCIERIAVIAPSPFDLPDVSAADAAKMRARIDAKNVVSVVGRLTPKKHVHRAIDYVGTRGRDSHLVVVGDGPEKARLIKYAKYKGVATTFVGRASRKDAATWIKASDELVLASIAEGCSTVAREAELLGVPVRRI